MNCDICGDELIDFEIENFTCLCEDCYDEVIRQEIEDEPLTKGGGNYEKP